MYRFSLCMVGVTAGVSLANAFAGLGLQAFTWWIACGAWMLAANEWKPEDKE